MAYNIIEETTEKLDFEKMYEMLYSADLGIEFIPMPSLGVDGGDAMGISVPSNFATKTIWLKLKVILKKLKSGFKCDIYNLYGGQQLGFFNINLFKGNLLG